MVSKAKKVRLLVGAVWGKIVGGLWARGVGKNGSGEVTAEDLNGAYDLCRRIAKREAKNFYYAFRVLPQA